MSLPVPHPYAEVARRRDSKIGFGTNRSSEEFSQLAEATLKIGEFEVQRRAVELGVTFIDTADAYGVGANEELLAEALHPYADGLLIATKVGHTRPAPNVWKPLGRPEYLKQAAELSPRRLKVERIDQLQLHRIDLRWRSCRWRARFGISGCLR